MPVKKKPQPPYRKPDSVRELERMADAEVQKRYKNVEAKYPLSHKSQSIIELMMTIIGLMTTIINNIEALFRGRLYPGSL